MDEILFAILMRAQNSNPSKSLGAGAWIRCAADCDLSAARTLLAVLGCGGTADCRHLPSAGSGDFTASTRRSGAIASGHAWAGIRPRLPVRYGLVRRDLLLDL